MRMKPLVGVTADRTMMGPHASHVTGEKYIAAAVDGAGALALVLPALGERQATADVLDAVDGLLFTGSYSNVEPHRYGGAPSEPGTLHDPARDATTLPLLDERPADVPPPAAGPSRFLQLHFLDHDPEAGWSDGYARIGQAIEDSGLATHVWTGPFIPTDFGTDRYTDELW